MTKKQFKDKNNKKICICPKCKSNLFRSFVGDYTYFCKKCYEDYYKFEVIEV